MVALGSMNVKHGTMVTLFNRRKPTIKTLGPKDIERLRFHAGELKGNQWHAVINGVAIVATVEDKPLW